MRRYVLSGLEHIHMMRHVPKSYDMTRTHIMHKGVNKHVDVVLRFSPKNWKKKKVTVSVVRSEKKNDAARIRANAKRGYVAVRKVVNDKFEADRRAAATAFETNYVTRSAGSDALIHDMKSQITTMAKKNAEYIDDQLTAKPAVSNARPVEPTAESQDVSTEVSTESQKPLISPETEEILKKGGYRLPNSTSSAGNPYAVDYIKDASNEEFHNLMDSLEKSLDEACRKYSIQPSEPDVDTTETETTPDEEKSASDYGDFSGYNGGYSLPGGVSLSVTKRQEKNTDEKENEEEFKPTLSFTDGGEHYISEDSLFDRELNRPGERYVPPANFFDDDDTAPLGDSGGEAYVPLPDPVVQPPAAYEPQNIFYTDDSDQPFEQSGGYPREDYVQQQVFFASQSDNNQSGKLYSRPDDQEEFAEPTIFHDSDEGESAAQDDENDYGQPMIFPDTGDEDAEPPMIFPDDDDDDSWRPMIFPDTGDEDAEPPMIFPDDDDEGYSPAPVSPDRNEYYGDDADNQGVMDRSGMTLFSRNGDRIKKVIGVIRGSEETNVGSSKENRNVEITYSDSDS